MLKFYLCGLLDPREGSPTPVLKGWCLAGFGCVLVPTQLILMAKLTSSTCLQVILRPGNKTII